MEKETFCSVNPNLPKNVVVSSSVWDEIVATVASI